jgi:hypothetical protein
MTDAPAAAPRRPLPFVAALVAMLGSSMVLGAFVVSDLAMAGEREAVPVVDVERPPPEVKVKKVVVTSKEPVRTKAATKSKRRAKSVEFGSFEGY